MTPEDRAAVVDAGTCSTHGCYARADTDVWLRITYSDKRTTKVLHPFCESHAGAVRSGDENAVPRYLAEAENVKHVEVVDDT